jgi:arylsulfatase A-like enzyme
VRSTGSRSLAIGLTAWAALALTLGGCQGLPPKEGDLPVVRNLVLVSLDTLRGDRLGGVRDGVRLMPRLEAFAARAALFSDCRSASGHTLASHKSMLSGRRPAVWLEAFSATRTGPPLPNADAYYREAMRPWPHPPVARLLKDAGLATAGFVDGGYVSGHLGFGEGFDVYDAPIRGLGAQTRAARRWIKEARTGRFFVFLHTYDIHCPYDPPPRYLALFGHECADRLEFGGTCGKTYFNLLDLTPEEREHVALHYDAGVRWVDEVLGGFLEWLESSGRERDTAVIVTSDHGESLGERSFVGHGQLYDDQLHVPLVIDVPGMAPAVVDDPVAGVDVGATILDLLLGRVPDGLDGRSLRGLLSGEDRGGPAPVRVSSVAVREGREDVTRLRKTAVMEPGGLKTIVDPDGGTVELYDLQRDPSESRNLVGAGDPRESRALELARSRTPGPLRGFGDERENLEKEGLSPEVRDALRALGYVED